MIAHVYILETSGEQWRLLPGVERSVHAYMGITAG
jgi:hypothetical protein